MLAVNNLVGFGGGARRRVTAFRVGTGVFMVRNSVPSPTFSMFFRLKMVATAGADIELVSFPYQTTNDARFYVRDADQNINIVQNGTGVWPASGVQPATGAWSTLGLVAASASGSSSAIKDGGTLTSFNAGGSHNYSSMLAFNSLDGSSAASAKNWTASEIAVWSTNLSENAFKQLYNSGEFNLLAANGNYTHQASLWAWWRFLEGAGTTVADSSGNSRTLTVSSGGWVTYDGP